MKQSGGLLLAAFLLAAGCGTSVQPAATPATDAINPPGPSPDLQGPSTGGNSNPAAIAALRQDVAMAFRNLKGYAGVLTTTDHKGSQTAHCVANVWYRAPERVRVDVTTNTFQPSIVGTHAVWEGGSTMKVRPSGLLGFAKVDLPITDERLCTLNNWPIDKISLKANIGVLLDPSSQVVLKGHSRVNGKEVVLADVSGRIPATGVTQLKMAVDLANKLPISIDFMGGVQPLYELRLAIQSLGPQSEDHFKL